MERFAILSSAVVDANPYGVVQKQLSFVSFLFQVYAAFQDDY